jgi:hypothetical protein
LEKITSHPQFKMLCPISKEYSNSLPYCRNEGRAFSKVKR